MQNRPTHHHITYMNTKIYTEQPYHTNHHNHHQRNNTTRSQQRKKNGLYLYKQKIVKYVAIQEFLYPLLVLLRKYRIKAHIHTPDIVKRTNGENHLILFPHDQILIKSNIFMNLPSINKLYTMMVHNISTTCAALGLWFLYIVTIFFIISGHHMIVFFFNIYTGV